jgi:hypothetical protein
MLFTHKIEPFGKQQNEDINCMATMRIAVQAKNERQVIPSRITVSTFIKRTKRIEGAASQIKSSKT